MDDGFDIAEKLLHVYNDIKIVTSFNDNNNDNNDLMFYYYNNTTSLEILRNYYLIFQNYKI